MGGEEADKFFNMEDLNADYGQKYRRTKPLNGNKENVVVDSIVTDRCALSSSTGKKHDHSFRVNRFNGQRSYSVPQNEPTTSVHPSNSMLTESTPNIVRLVGKRRKLGDLPSSPIVTPRSNSGGNYMNPPEGSQDITPLSDLTNLGSASFSRNMVKGLNVVAPSLWSDFSEGSDYEASGCESSDETNQLVGKFRQQRDLYESDEIVELQITLKVIRSESGRECHISSTD
ncbi:hypothetical protein AgCh_033959 [Apium graveolens]